MIYSSIMNSEKNYVGKYLRIPIADHDFIKEYIEPRRSSYQVFIEQAIEDRIRKIKVEKEIENLNL